LVAAALHGAWNVLTKVSGNPLRTLQRANAVAAIVATPFVGVAWLVAGRPTFSLAALGLCVGSAVLELMYMWTLSRAYQLGDLSAVYPIARGTAPVLAVAVGLLVLGEHLAPLQLFGVALLLVGIVTVARPKSAGRATLLALATGVLIASYSSVDRIGVRLVAPWLFGWLMLVLVATGLWAWGSFAKWGGTEGLPWRRAGIVGLLQWGGYFLVLVALSIAPLAIVAPVRESAIVAVALWGVFKLREREGAPLKVVGAALTFAGIVLLAI
jgi:drug/metabolite transporter (DMT)-like permease